MKKLLCLILALVMVMCLCACGQDNTENSGDSNQQNSANEPSADEQALMQNYKDLALRLKDYTSTGAVTYKDGEKTVYGQEALALIRKDLEAMEALDKWYGSQWMPKDDTKVNWDRQKLLSGFAAVKDVLAKQDCVLTGADGTAKTYENAYTWTYNADGTVAGVDFMDMFHSKFYPFCLNMQTNIFYDAYKTTLENYGEDICSIGYEYDDGLLYQVTRYSPDRKDDLVIINVECDEDTGLLLSATGTDTNDETINYTFTYDDQNRLTKITSNKTQGISSCTYTYNDKGQLDKAVGEELIRNDYNPTQVFKRIETYTYTYDAAGNVTKVELSEKYNNTVTPKFTATFTYDDQGRPLTVTFDKGSMELPSGDVLNYTKAEFKYVYGDVCAYTPAK